MPAGENQPQGRSWVPSLLQDSGWQTGRAWVTLGAFLAINLQLAHVWGRGGA